MASHSYSLDEADYMHYLLYSTSQSKKVQKRRALNKLILMFIYVVTGLFLYNKNGPIASAGFFILCLPLYFLYSGFEKKQYNRHFRKFIQNHFQSTLGKPSTISLDEENFTIQDDENNTHSYKDIEEISETGELYIIQLKSGNAILLPKKKIENNAGLSDRLKQIVSSHSIPLNQNVNWKWK